MGRNEEHLERLFQAFNTRRGELGAIKNLLDAVDSQLVRFFSDLPDESGLVASHPALTDYGPESAANFFRQAHAKANHRPSAAGRSSYPQSGRDDTDQTDKLEMILPNPNQKRQISLQTSSSSLETPKVARQPSDLSTGIDGHQLPLTRRGPKRIRRDNSGRPEDHEESHANPQNEAQNVAIPGAVDTSPAQPWNLHDSHISDVPFCLGLPSAREPAPTIRPSTDASDSSLPDDPGKDLLRYWLRRTSPKVKLEDKGSPEAPAHRRPRTYGSLRDADHDGPGQEPGFQSIQSALNSNQACLFRPVRGVQASNRQTTSDHDCEDSGIDSTDRLDDSAPESCHAGRKRKVLRSTPRRLHSNLELRQNGDVIFPSLDGGSMQTIPHEQNTTLLRPAIAMVEGDCTSASFKEPFPYQRIMPLNLSKNTLHQERRNKRQAPSGQENEEIDKSTKGTLAVTQSTLFDCSVENRKAGGANSRFYQASGMLKSKIPICSTLTEALWAPQKTAVNHALSHVDKISPTRERTVDVDGWRFQPKYTSRYPLT